MREMHREVEERIVGMDLGRKSALNARRTMRSGRRRRWRREGHEGLVNADMALAQLLS
jgi:hypothetical protein